MNSESVKKIAECAEKATDGISDNVLKLKGWNSQPIYEAAARLKLAPLEKIVRAFLPYTYRSLSPDFSNPMEDVIYHPLSGGGFCAGINLEYMVAPYEMSVFLMEDEPVKNRVVLVYERSDEMIEANKGFNGYLRFHDEVPCTSLLGNLWMRLKRPNETGYPQSFRWNYSPCPSPAANC